MRTKQDVENVVAQLRFGLASLFLVDASRQEISASNWQVGDLAADFLLEHGVMVSPIVENRDYFSASSDILPFYRNIVREGVRMGA